MPDTFRKTLFAILLASAGSAASAAPGTLAFVGARIIDGTGAAAIEDAVLVATDGRIVAVGPAASTPVPEGAQRIDVAGKTLIPGLINTHGHVGDVLGLEAGHYDRGNVLRQLGLYARYGVTTVNSLGDDEYEGFEVRNEQNPLYLDHARLLVAGPVLAPETVEQAVRAVNGVADQSVNYVKIRVDDNLGRTAKMAPEIVATIAQESEKRGIPLAVHTYTLADTKATLAAGADLIAHSVRDAEVDDEFMSAIKAADVCYVPTLTRELSTFVYESEPAFFSDPFFLRDADPALRNLKTLQDNGVKVAMGTDSGPATRFQGYFEHLEMSMMVEAGLTPMQVLQSATQVAADCLGLNYLGTLEPGKWADVLVLDRNPLEDIANTRSLSQVWIAGNPVPPAP